MNKVTIGLDTAKSVFHLVSKNAQGRILSKKKLKRAQVLDFFANLPPSIVVMEACASSHYGCRVISRLGHEVKAIPPQYIVPYRKGNKNDYNDAEAIAESAQRENMRFVPFKSQSQQDVQLVHRVRERLIGQRTALSNQTRGLLAEYGIVLSKGLAQLTKGLPYILEDAENELSIMTRHQFRDLLEELKD